MADAWEFAGEEWKGGRDGYGTPAFFQWFRARIRAIVASWEWSAAAVGFLVTYAEEDLDRYCDWVAAAEFRGDGFSNGHYVVNHKTLLQDYIEDAANTSLDYWLRADLKGFLPAEAVPTEPCGADVLNASGLSTTRYFDQVIRVHNHWPANCRKCGESFRTTRKGQEVCRPCRGLPAKAAPAPRVYRAKVCNQCDAAFTPASGRQVTCTACKPSKSRGRSA